MVFHRASDAKGMSLRQFLDCHTSSELTEIIVRDRLDPYDHVGRTELATARLCSLIYSMHRTGNMDPLTASDFLPVWGRLYRDTAEAEEMPNLQTPEQMRATIQAYRGK
jgi:hypothetical protein